MEIILREDVEKLGTRGPTESNRKIAEQECQAHLRKEAKEVGEAQEVAKLVGAVTVTISRRAGENQLFGSVTTVRLHRDVTADVTVNVTREE